MNKKKQRRIKPFTRNLSKEEQKDFTWCAATALVVFAIYFLLADNSELIEYLRSAFLSLMSNTFFVIPFFTAVKKRHHNFDMIATLIGIMFLILYYLFSGWDLLHATKFYLTSFFSFLFLGTVIKIVYKNILYDRRPF